MELGAWLTIAVIGVIFVALARNMAPTDWLFIGGTTLLAACGVITAEEALAGFSNPGMLTVAALFVVAAGLRDTGILDYLGQRILGGARSWSAAMWRLTGLTLPLSAFLNNTPIVAMMMPIVMDWCRRNNLSPSRLLIPLSFLTIFGGTCTLIGTSTNLVINGLMLENKLPGMHLFEIAWIGVPYALIGVAYLFLCGPKLLPDRRELIEQLGEARREYLTEMRVDKTCPLVGKTVEESSLRGLQGLFLIEIDRNGEVIAPVRPDHKIQAEDRLVFVGIVSSIVELERIPGLIPIADPNYEVKPHAQSGRRLWEAVVSESSPLVGKTLKEADFRATYGAAVLAVHRGGQRIRQKLGEICIRPGDTMLLLAARHFRRAFRNDPAFYLISDVREWRPLRRELAWIAVAIFTALISAMTFGFLPVEISAFLAAVAMVGARCISASDARRSIDWQVLLTIGASFGMGTALQKSGAAAAITSMMFSGIEGWGPHLALAIMFLLGTLITALITNNAAAVLLFPFCLEIAATYQQSDPRPFIMALVLAASASFLTPIGYQTNMMIYGPGGYRFGDFLRIGVPLTLLLWLTATLLIPLIWPFH